MYRQVIAATTILAVTLAAASDVRSQPASTVTQSGSEVEVRFDLTGPVAPFGRSAAAQFSDQLANTDDGLWLLKERHTDIWDNNTSDWVWSAKDVRGYDSRGFQTEQTYVYWRSGAWQSDRRWLSAYDSEGRQLEEVFQEWQNGSWKNSYRTLFTYADFGALIELVQQSSSGSTWDNSWKGVNSYDDQGRLIESGSFEWRNQRWVQLPEVFQYVYDSQDRLNTQTTLLIENGQLRPLNRQVVVFDAGGNQTHRLYDVWSGSSWSPDMRFTYKYYGDVSPEQARKGGHPDNDALTERLLEVWRNDRWNNSNRLTGGFDSTGRQTLFISEYWSGTQWVGVYRNLVAYDDAGLIQTLLNESWSEAGWTPSTRRSYTWERFAGEVGTDWMPDLPNHVLLDQNYPNPFNPSTTIGYSLSAAGRVRFVVFDLVGRIVSDANLGHHTAGTFQVNFDGSTLSSGSYIYRIESGGTGVQRTMTILK